MKRILYQIFKPFGVTSVTDKVNHFYEILKLTVIFTFWLLPWSILVAMLKFSLETSIFYMLISLWLLINVGVFFSLIKFVYMSTESHHLRVFWQLYRAELKSWWKYEFKAIALIVIVLSMFIIEVLVVIKIKDLAFLVYPILLLGSLFTASAFYLINFSYHTIDMSLTNSFVKAVSYSWRYPLSSLIIAMIFGMWLSFAYNAPILNFLFGNQLCFWSLYLIINHKLHYNQN